MSYLNKKPTDQGRSATQNPKRGQEACPCPLFGPIRRDFRHRQAAIASKDIHRFRGLYRPSAAGPPPPLHGEPCPRGSALRDGQAPCRADRIERPIRPGRRSDPLYSVPPPGPSRPRMRTARPVHLRASDGCRGAVRTAGRPRGRPAAVGKGPSR